MEKLIKATKELKMERILTDNLFKAEVKEPVCVNRIFICPTCGNVVRRFVEFRSVNYCYHCGQRFNYEKETT